MEKETGSKLGRQDWLTIGIQTLIEKGIEAVRVDPLAKLLNVTRGSFYWHFKNRDDLLEEILHEWEARNTKSIIEQIDGLNSSPNAKLLSLLEVAAEDNNFLEKAVRVWSFNDVKAAAAIARVDKQRLDYLQNLFLQLGFSEIDSKVRAQIAYSVRLGWFVMASSSYASERLTEIRLIHTILTQTNNIEAMP
ncbi:TetR/AcrR family transcriptional regulator [Phormidesmis sp. 146-33]